MILKSTSRFTNFYDLVKLLDCKFDSDLVRAEFGTEVENMNNMIGIPLRYHYYDMLSDVDKQLLKIFYGDRIVKVKELSTPKVLYTKAETDLNSLWNSVKESDPLRFYNIESLLIKKLKEYTIA